MSNLVRFDSFSVIYSLQIASLTFFMFFDQSCNRISIFYGLAKKQAYKLPTEWPDNQSINVINAKLQFCLQCMRCGPGGEGQCFGPDICCGETIGCHIKSDISAVCAAENNIPVSCAINSPPCADGSGYCATNDLCCNEGKHSYTDSSSYKCKFIN